MKDYEESNATYGEAVWDMPKGKFIYAQFTIREIEYNVRDWKSFQAVKLPDRGSIPETFTFPYLARQQVSNRKRTILPLGRSS